MLPQLRRLTRDIPSAGPGAQAIAVYAHPASAAHTMPDIPRPAREQGFEGVACVDDAARAIVLYCRPTSEQHDPLARVNARNLLRFLAYMQDEDGRFANFIVDWAGRKNLTGGTSSSGGAPWQARALHALAWGIAAFGDAEWEERFQRALRWVDVPMRYADIRAVCVLAVLKHWQATGSPHSVERCIAWASEIASIRDGDRLLNIDGEQSIHLWGHLQETALAETGRLLDRPELVETARASAGALLHPAAEALAVAPHALPFEVSCIVSGLAAVARATADPSYSEAAARARAWFSGRNSAGIPVYDRARGLVYDGIDEGRVSRNSGAESNIEGALALLV